MKQSAFTYIFLLIFSSLLVVGCDDDDDAPPPPAGYVKVFVTSLAYDGNFVGAGGAFPTGLDGADAACTDAANSAGQSGSWTAWLSDNTSDAADRIFDGGVPYQRIDGTIVASNKADLLDGSLLAPIDIDESGNSLNAALEVWTATAADGTNPGLGSCLEWSTNVNTERGRIGTADAIDASWTDLGGGNPCDFFNRLYCFANAVSN
jgi:hypothetical protein